MRYGPTLVVGLAGALAMTVGVAKPWVTATARQSGLPQIEVTVSGASLAPLAGALGVVVLAAFGAVVATRGWVRRDRRPRLSVFAKVDHRVPGERRPGRLLIGLA